YAYDAYGRNFINVDIDGIATSNPFRYRGYFWDSDLSLYYLMSRYYDPATSRFINADSLEYLDPESIHGLNLFAYCYNNPIMYFDPSGHEAEWWQWALFALGIVLIAVAAGMAILGTGGIAAFGIGALIGSLSLGSVGAIVGSTIGYATSGSDGIAGGALVGFGIGATIGFVVGGCLGYNVSRVPKPGTKYNGVGEYVKNPKIKWKSSNFPHLGDRMVERNVSANLIQQTLKNGYAFKQTADKFLIISKKAAVVVTVAGEVITTWSASQYGPQLIELLKHLFGY
ncbi:MAG: hypothetical protein IJF10_05870, partial [Clostridia bacterium]|nr:hypothetical protein [Clostridia bacterium]